MTDKKYVLCRPIGGLNDSLCQVEHCLSYAEAHGRILIVDGRNSGIMGEFGDYFAMAGDRHIFNLTDPAMPDLDALDCRPAALRGRVTTSEWKKLVGPDGMIAVDALTDAPLRFDRTKDFPETLLVHQQWGGGINSFGLLDRLTLAPELARQTRAMIDQLPTGYYALHIRNTDYKTDVPMVMESIRKLVIGQDLLLCSDDAKLFAEFREGLPQTRLHQITVAPFKTGQALHVIARDKDFDVRHQVAANSIIELCALAGAARLFVPVLHSQGTRNGVKLFAGGPVKLSGFSRVASYLGQKKARLRRLLGAAGEGMLPGLDAGVVIRIEPTVVQAVT